MHSKLVLLLLRSLAVPICTGVRKLNRDSEKYPCLSLSVSCAQNQNSLKASLLCVLGPVLNSMCSYWDVSQLVLLLFPAPCCRNVIDE